MQGIWVVRILDPRHRFTRSPSMAKAEDHHDYQQAHFCHNPMPSNHDRAIRAASYPSSIP
jgi:hypothetical protein